jgi:hypothetical protein
LGRGRLEKGVEMRGMKKVLRLLSWPFRMVLRMVVWVLLIPWRVARAMVRAPGVLLRGAKALPGGVWRFTLALPGSLWRALLAIPRLIWQGIRTLVRWVLAPPRLVWRGIVGIARMIRRSPRKTYESVRHARDWLLAKVEYLQSESAKWRALFTTIKLPYTALRSLGLNPQMAATMLFGATAVTGGVVVNEVVFAEKSFSRGDPGVYNAPLDTPIFAAEDFNTLRLDLGTTPVGAVTIQNITVGTAFAGSALPSGETNVVIIGGIATSTSPAFSETYLHVGHMIIDRWRCTTLKLTNIEAHELIVRDNASDGQSIAAVAGTPRARGIGGGNRADDMVTSGGLYDQVKLTSASSGVNGQIDKLTLSNLYTKGGGCVLDRIKAGTLEVILNETGAGNGFATKDFQIATSVIYKSFVNEDNVEVSISPPA